jgi:N-acetylglucosaminyl-diphospho-decaprenol L-rhamnosyltransferase
MSGARIDIVLVNWNSGDQLAAALRSIAAHGDGLVASVVVVDNGSTDGSADLTVPGLPLAILKTGQNLGFGAACNLGAARGTAPFLLFLNPDAELKPGTLAGAVAHLEADPAVGAVGVQLVDEGGGIHRHCARFPTWRAFVGQSLGLFRLGRGYFKPIPLLEFDHRSSRQVDHVMGAFYCMRRALFEQLGGFDEAFFLYMEDLDLSKRIVDSGHRIDYRADLVAFHKQGGTSEQIKARRLAYILSSNIIYAWKHRPWGEAVAVSLVTLVGEPVSLIARFAVQGRLSDSWAAMRGFGMLYRALPDTVRRVRRARAA